MIKVLAVVAMAAWLTACGEPERYRPSPALAFIHDLSCRELGRLGIQITDDLWRFEAQARETRSRDVATRTRELASQASEAIIQIEAAMWRQDC